MKSAPGALFLVGLVLSALVMYERGEFDRLTNKTPPQQTVRVEPRILGPAGGTAETAFWAEVVRVVDGDTLVAAHGTLEFPVRLLCVNTPERSAPGYSEATSALERLVGKRVRLEWEQHNRAEADRYGRILAYVFSESGDLVNADLVRLGHSEYWTKFGAGRFEGVFRDAELDRAAPR